MRRRHPIIEETIVAAIALALISGSIAVIFWYATGRSPWPGLILAEAVMFSWGLILVVVTSPSWGR